MSEYRWEIFRCDVNTIVDGKPVRDCKHEGSCGAWERITETDDPAVYYQYRCDFRGDRIPGISIHENPNHPDYGKPLPPWRYWEAAGSYGEWYCEEKHLGDSGSYETMRIPVGSEKKAKRMAMLLNQTYRQGLRDAMATHLAENNN
jgi:hypothetical protein